MSDPINKLNESELNVLNRIIEIGKETGQTDEMILLVSQIFNIESTFNPNPGNKTDVNAKGPKGLGQVINNP